MTTEQLQRKRQIVADSLDTVNASTEWHVDPPEEQQTPEQRDSAE